jgi:hypothetical protein
MYFNPLWEACSKKKKKERKVHIVGFWKPCCLLLFFLSLSSPPHPLYIPDDSLVFMNVCPYLVS